MKLFMKTARNWSLKENTFTSFSSIGRRRRREGNGRRRRRRRRRRGRRWQDQYWY